MKTIKYIILSMLTLSFFACENEELDELRDRNSEDDEVVLPELTAGTADFSNYVAVGASFTAGFTDNGLFIASQENSFPNIIANQFANVGGGTFNQPLMNDNFGGLILGGNPVIDPMSGERLFEERLVFGGAGPVPLQAVNPAAMSTTDFALNNPTGPFNNLGIPGAKSFHLIAPGYGNLGNFPAAANPYAIRVTGNAPNASILELAVAQNPTFFTLSEIGGNDVLGYATSGGDGSNSITDTATFDFALNTLINSLTANGAKGAIGNLPNITSLPHFTTVPHNPVPLDAATAGFLNSAAAYGAYNAGIVQAFAFLVANTPMTQEMADTEIEKRTISFAAGEGNAVVIFDESLTDLTAINPALVSMRQATEDDLIVLPASSFIGTEAVPGNPQTVNGVAIPLEDKWVLTPEEQDEITVATQAYNASILAAASANGLALVDLNSILEQASTMGIVFDEFNLNTDLVFGGLVSLDGIHLTARGYALMANSFLEAIDATYGSNFVASGNVAKAGEFPTNYSPALQ
ncbi:G-D-S-L family lipolytic protein [Winogradskyella luteola]|uniref:G-D-S-L family lipolytic protein n=1 Tax=Winogradskyella luteola TaxID=2828330 RepID=A0A9X1F933_9FLAO|nr:G-D-S-L family lipolytic protein [Winogradskyella luteola]MBV7268828.1 G-D-S-L family lipolytic protein [Winogradskyella luteola]